MIPALKSEFRKLFSVRSTYVILLVVALLLVFFAFYIGGWKVSAADLHSPTTLAKDVTGAISAVAVFSALVAVLLVTQEYRYNLISYTLTAANNRNKVLVAKLLVASGFAIVFSLIAGWLSPVLSVWGAQAHGLHFAPQVIDHGHLLWTTLFYGWGYTMAGLLIALLIRNQIGSIIVLFIAPGTVEALLGLLLKQNTVYLPFTALSVVLGEGMHSSFVNASATSPAKAAGVFMIYLVVGWIVAWVLFLRRDAMN
jgi:ABC-type transport system involved in multi-copper enzyme maturation permease subunit